MPFYSNTGKLVVDMAPDPRDESGAFNEFTKGVSSGVDQLQGLIGGGGQALVGSLFGNDEMFYDGMAYYNEQMAEAAENQADVGRIEDIDGFGDLVNYSAFIVGNVIPSLVGGGGVGALGGVVAKQALKKGINAKAQQYAKDVVKDNALKVARKQAGDAYAKTALGSVANKGRIAGAVGFGTAAGAGESFTRILEETGEEAAGLALVTGVASGALDAMAPLRLLNRILPSNLYSKATKEISEKIAANPSRITRALREAGKQAGIEGVTEMTQEIIQNVSVEYIREMNDPELEASFMDRLFDESRRSAYMNAAVAGAIGGFSIGGVSGSLSQDPTGGTSASDKVLGVGRKDSILNEQEEAPEASPESSDPETTTEQDLAQARRRKQLDAVGIPTESPQGELDVGGVRDPEILGRRQKEAKDNAQGLPEKRGENVDPQARILEAREGARARLDNLPNARGIAKSILENQSDLYFTYENESVAVPAKPAVAEEAPTFGGNLPDPSQVSPPMESLVGKDIDYQGIKGVLTRKDDGFYVVAQEGDVFIESGDFASPEQLGVTVLTGDVQFTNDVSIDPQTKKFNLREKEFTLTSIRRDSDGNPISLAVRDNKGKKRTIREPEIVQRITTQSEQPPAITGNFISLDDLPTSVQEVIVRQGAESNTEINDQIDVEVALEVASSLPEAQRESAIVEVTDLSESSMLFKPTDEKFFSESKYVGSVRRPSTISLSDSISEVNKGLGEGRTPIDEARLRETLSISKTELIDGSPVRGVSDFYGDAIQADEVLSAVVDLIEMGMPKSVLNDFNGIGIHDPAIHPSMKKTDGAYNLESGTITLKKGYVNALANDAKEAERIRYTIAHEIGHAYDIKNNITNDSVEFSAEVNGVAAEGLDIELGDVIHELAQSYQNKNELGREMAYPFGYIFDWVNASPEKIESRIDVMKKEAFAQAFSVFHSNPDLLESSAPLTYNYLVKLLRTQPAENNQNAQNDNQAEADVGERGAVQEDVRTSTQPRSSEVSDGEGDQLVSRDGARQEEASEGLGRETQREDGDDTGQPLQLSEQEDPLDVLTDYNGTDMLLEEDADLPEVNAVSEQEKPRAEEDFGDVDAELTEVSDEFPDFLGDPLDLLTDYDGTDFLFSPVSTRFPTGKKRTEDPIADLIVNDYESFVNSGALFSKNVALIKSYTNLTKEEQVGSDEVVAERFINHMVDNLLYIYDSVPESTRELSKQWYEGANKIVQRMADKHGISLAQASAVAANLSPQKDWYQNASLAERVMNIYHENINDSFDQNMKDKADVIYFNKDVKPPARITNRKKLDFIQGKSLQQLIDEKASPHVLGMWVRTWDQTYNSPNYRIVSPDGKFLEYAVNKDGKTRSRAGWGSLAEIGKALTAVMNPEIEVLSESLGDANKVRNFYNNIFDPASTLGFVTIDTHAVAAALIRPLGGKAEEVGANFGTQKGSSNSKVTGHRGTYSLYEEAYRRAAKEKGVLPREMQSITWEAVRGLFTSTYKAQKQNVTFVQGVWNQYNKGKLSLAEARKKINDHSGGVERPSWERSDFTIPDEASDTSYERIVPDGDISRPESGLQETAGSGTGIDVTRVPTDTEFLSSPPRQETTPNLTPEEANAAQNARIREEKSFVDSATSWASRTFRRNLAPQGLLNDEVFESKIKRDGEIGAVEIDIRMYIASYDEAIKNAYPEGTEVPESVLNDALQVPVEQLEAFDLPKEVKDVVGRMRRYIDKYSADYSEVIQSQLDALDSETQTKEIEAKQSLLSTFKSNLGKYLNRSYRAFDDPNWAKSVPDNVLNNAKEYLAKNGATNVERVINTILKEGTAFDGIGSFIVNSKLGAKDLSILKKKNNTIAPEILALLGEYKEPRINFVKTATKLSRLVFNHKFLEDVKAKGEGAFLFTEETAPSDAYVKLAADQSDVMSPLNGFYVTPELKQGFEEANGLDSLTGVYQNLIALNSIVKYGKTVIAPTTIARNFMSAGFFTVANGHFDWSKTQKSLEVARSYFNSKEGDATAYLRELKRWGVVYDTPIAGELIKAMEDSGIDALQNELVGSEMAKGKLGKAKSKLQVWASGAAKFYQYGDDFWKIVGFQNEMDMLMEAKGLSYEDAAPIAAERIRNTYPTYSLIGRAMQQLRRFPLAGTFVSFPAEIIRTSFNMFKYLKQDMADPDMRPSVHRRLAGMALVSGGIYAIQAAAFAAWDVSEEEEEAIRLMSPEWSRNSNIVVTGRDEKGDLEYIDLTYLDPYAYWTRPINALLRDQPVDDALVQSAQEMLTPFFGKDISAGTVFNLMVNEKDSGGRIYNPADTATNITADMGGFLFKNLAPSVFQNISRTMKAVNGEVSKSGKKYEVGDEALAWVGFRTTTFDPKVSLHFKAYEFNQDKRDATSILTSTFRDPNDVSNGDLINAFERASGARKEGFERMIKLVSAARSSGLNDTQLMMVLRSNGVTKKDARSLVKGDYEAWAMSDSTLKNTIKKSDLLFGKAKGKEFEDRWKLIQELLSREM